MEAIPLPAPQVPTQRGSAMRLTVLGSGSSGNCSLLSDGDTHVLIDAGFSYVEICRRLQAAGFDAGRLTAVLVTHEHQDHVQSVHTVTNRLKIPFFSTQGTFDAAFTKRKFFDWHEIVPGRGFSIGRFVIHPITLPHDAADPVGFRIESGDKTLAHLTDFGYVSGLIRESLAQCDLVVVEANHDIEMLRNGPYPWPLKQRIASRLGHLSNDALLELLPDFVGPRLQHIVLGHLSETNNNRKLLEIQLKKMLCRLGLPNLPYSIASQHQVLEPVAL